MIFPEIDLSGGHSYHLQQGIAMGKPPVMGTEEPAVLPV
jgi:hypothetical protein